MFPFPRFPFPFTPFPVWMKGHFESFLTKQSSLVVDSVTQRGHIHFLYTLCLINLRCLIFSHISTRFFSCWKSIPKHIISILSQLFQPFKHKYFNQLPKLFTRTLSYSFSVLIYYSFHILFLVDGQFPSHPPVFSFSFLRFNMSKRLISVCYLVYSSLHYSVDCCYLFERWQHVDGDAFCSLEPCDNKLGRCWWPPRWRWRLKAPVLSSWSLQHVPLRLERVSVRLYNLPPLFWDRSISGSVLPTIHPSRDCLAPEEGKRW